MNNFTITSHENQSILFEGAFSSFQECLENAVTQGVKLYNADLQHKNLSHTNLDDAKLCGADLSYSNLDGANLSESDLSRCNFSQASLYNTCLAYSDLREYRFTDTQFGASDICGADLSSSIFRGQSCFTLNFIEAKDMKNCSYINDDNTSFPINTPPVVIMGLSTNPVVYLDHHVKFGPLTKKKIKFN